MSAVSGNDPAGSDPNKKQRIFVFLKAVVGILCLYVSQLMSMAVNDMKAELGAVAPAELNFYPLVPLAAGVIILISAFLSWKKLKKQR